MAKGVMSGAMSVEQAVIVTESATFPLARNAMTLDATPPEHEPMSTTPAAISSGNPKDTAMAHPRIGMTLNCKAMPIRTACGIRSARRKSPTLKVAPIPSMMSWMSGTVSLPSSKSPHDVKCAGKYRPQVVSVNTQNVNAMMFSLG